MTQFFSPPFSSFDKGSPEEEEEEEEENVGKTRGRVNGGVWNWLCFPLPAVGNEEEEEERRGLEEGRDRISISKTRLIVIGKEKEEERGRVPVLSRRNNTIQRRMEGGEGGREGAPKFRLIREFSNSHCAGWRETRNWLEGT